METQNETILPEIQPEARTTAPPATAVSPVADTAMATGNDAEPDMTIADKHLGEDLPDLDGDGELTTEEAAQLLGDSGNDNDRK